MNPYFQDNSSLSHKADSDDNSHGYRQEDFFNDDNYENNFLNNSHQQINKNDIIRLEQQDTIFTLQDALKIIRQQFSPHYSKALQLLINNFNQIPVQIMQQSIRNICQKNVYFQGRTIQILVINVNFMFKIICKIGTQINQKNYNIINQMLNINRSLYNSFFTVSQFGSNIMKLGEKSSDIEIYTSLNSLHTSYCQTRQRISSQQQDQNSPPTQLKYILWQLLSKNIIKQCFVQPQAHKTIRCILLSRMPKALQHHYITSLQDYSNLLSLNSQQYYQMHKNMVEPYSYSILLFSSKNINMLKQYLLPLIIYHLNEDNSIEKKVLGIKLINQLINLSKTQQNIRSMLLEWVCQKNLLNRFLRDDSHNQILRKICLLVRFMYQNNKLPLQLIKQLVSGCLHSHEQMFKLVQMLITYIQLNHLDQVFTLITTNNFNDYYQGNHMIGIVSSIISNCHLVPTSKNKIQVMEDVHQNFSNIEENCNNEIHTYNIVLKIFQFLIKIVQKFQNQYINILNRFISTQIYLLNQFLTVEIINFCRNGHVCVAWILEHCLKMQTSKQKGQLSNKYEFICKLANEGLYQYLLAMLARHRFNKCITDKILSVVISLCRYHKPLQKHQIQYIWRVIGLKSRDQKEREQFFIFIKDILRHESTLTQECVNYVYFEILLRSHHQWFSIRVYDCFEMLFMRLNEDCKLIEYINSQYSIIEAELIGLQKFWYIYFGTQDIKVVRKCRDFLYKLSTYENQMKQIFLQNSIKIILKHMIAGKQQVSSEQIIMRGFEMIEKMIQQKKEDLICKEEIKINIIINNATREALPPKKKTIEVPENMTLQQLRSFISEGLNPPVTDIELVTRGADLRGQKMTIRQLKIHQNQTILVENIENSKAQKEKKNEENRKQVISMFEEKYDKGLLNFLMDKLQGQLFSNIIDTILNQQQFKEIETEYNLKMRSQKLNQDRIEEQNNNTQLLTSKLMQSQKVLENQKVEFDEKQRKKFSVLLTKQLNNIKLLLHICQVLNHPNIWEILKKLPSNPQVIVQLLKITSKEFNCFFDLNQPMLCLYYTYILYNLLIKQPQITQFLLEEHGFRNFMLSLLTKLLAYQHKNFILYELINYAIRIIIMGYSNGFEGYKKYINLNKPEPSLLSDLEQQMRTKHNQKHYKNVLINVNDCLSMIKVLIDQKVPEETAHMMCLMLLNFILNHQESIFKLTHFTHNNIKTLLLCYGKFIEYPLLVQIAQSKTLKVKNQDYYGFLEEEKSQSYFICHQQSSSKYYSSFYNYLINLLNQCKMQLCKYEHIIDTLMEHLKQYINSYAQQQMVGVLKLINIMQINLKSIKQISASHRKNLLQFIPWLFKQYLFNLNNPKVHFRSKQIRKISYQFLLTLSYDIYTSQCLKQSIIQLKIHQKNYDDDNTDFRQGGFIGIRNLGCTCYINSLLQQLFHTKFSKLILQNDQIENNNQPIKMLALKKIFIGLYTSVKNVLNISDFIKSIKFYGEDINPNMQHDATQFLMCLLEYIDEADGKSIVEKVFGGTLCNQISGLEEGFQFIKQNQEHFNTLSIDIKGKKNLQEALIYFTKGQILDGENMYYCEELSRKTKAMKKTSIEDVPNILILTLKRFQFEYETMMRHKLNDYFEFPMELDMYRYCSPKVNVDSGFKYRLAGVLIHSGSAESGHYYSYIRIGEKWFQFNDKIVTEINIMSNLKSQCFGGSQGRSRNAYMLFYDKIGSNYHGIFLNELSNQNRLVSIIRQQNSTFIRNRLVYDGDYLQFLKNLNSLRPDNNLQEIINTIQPQKIHFVHYEMPNDAMQVQLLDNNQEQKKQ